MDFEGHLKSIPLTCHSSKDFAIKFLTPASSYVAVKIETDPITDEKHFTCLLDESKQNGNILSKNPNLSIIVEISQ